MTLQERIKAKLEALNQQQSNEKREFKNNSWKPAPGKQTIRILPFTSVGLDEEHPFLPLDIYYNYGKRWMISPSFFGEPDPVIEYANSLIPEGGGMDKEDWKRAKEIQKKLLPALRIYAAVLVRGQEHEGPKFWSFSPYKVYPQFKEFFEGDYSDAANLENGIDFTVNFTPSPTKDQRQATTVVAPTRNSSPASEDPAVLKMIQEMGSPLDDIHHPTYDELKNALGEYLKVSKQTEHEEPEAKEEPKVQESTTDSKPTTANLEDIEKLFAGLETK